MNTVQFPDKQIVEAQAAAWVAKIDRGISNVEEEALVVWLSKSALHGDALVALASMWDLLDILEPIAKLLPLEQQILDSNEDQSGEVKPKSAEVLRPNTTTQKPRFEQLIPLAVAACFTLVAITALFSTQLLAPNTIRHTPTESVTDASSGNASGTINENKDGVNKSVQTYTTAVGEQSNIRLADGSEIKLNTDTQLRVQFTQSTRQIRLIRGEAFFDVAKNPQKPFVVLTNTNRVTAIGTAFSVDVSRNDNVEVLVAEGLVKVDRFSASQLESASVVEVKVAAKQEPVFLSQGQKVSWNETSSIVLSEQDIESELAWRDGMIVFTGQSLEQAVMEIDRYIPLEFKIVDKDIASIPVGGFFKTGDLDQLLVILQQNFGVKSDRQGDQILLSKGS